MNSNIENLCVNKPSSKILERIKQFSKSIENKEFAPGKKLVRTIVDNSKINIWEVSNRIFFVGQTWNSGTETLTHKNNVNETKIYLDELFGSKYLILSVEQHLKDFDRVLYCPNLWYDLEYINKICIAIKAWLDIDMMNVIVIEINYNIASVFAILYHALLVYCGYENSITGNIFIDNEILRSKTNNSNTISRYNSNYSSLIHSNKTEMQNIILLHQIIISNYHRFENHKNFRVQLKIFKNNKNIRTVHDVDDIDVIYKDDYHIVFTNIDLEANCDITMGLYFIIDTKEKEIFKFAINGNCHDQGLYRFKKNDLISEYKYKYSDEFKLDIVFLESEKYFTPKKTMKEPDLIQGIRHLTEFTNNNRSDSIFEKYNSLGYNRIISKLISQMSFSDEYVKELISLLRNKGYKNLISKSKPLHVSQILFKNNDKINQSVKPNDQINSLIKEQTINRERVYKGIRGKEILKVEPINEDFYSETKTKIPQKKMAIRKKSQIDINDDPPALVSIKPLHWMPIIAQEKTIFTELEDYELDYDLKKFEKYFCVRNIETNENKIHTKEHFHLIDSKRLFLVSLALNHLNKKQITHENVYDLLKNKPNLIQIQDLLNIEKVFPTYEETYLLASSDLEKLSPEEKSMLNFSRLSEVKKIVEILIFERKFFDEIFLIDDILERYDYTLNRIIESEDLRILLKAFLDIGNIINYDYSLRRRKLNSFKLSGIYLFMDFKGKDGYHILDFIISSINRPNLIENLKKDFKFLEMLRKESFIKIREKINHLIELQTSKLDAYHSLEYDKEVFTNLFIFSSEKLSTSKSKFANCQEMIEKVVELFGESQKKSISDIFRSFYDLLKTLQEHVY